MPHHCPDHPESGAVSSETNTTPDGYPSHTMIQHRCAEPDCQQPLGWEYHGPRNKFLSGAGRCTPEIELMVAQEKHDAESHGLVGAIGIICLLPFSILWGLTAHHAGDPWTGLHTIAASIWFPTVALGLYLLAKKFNRDRPQEPQEQASSLPNRTP